MGHQLNASSASEAGFTLIELLVVIAILAVLAVGAGLAATQQGTPRAVAADLSWFQTRFTTARAMAVTGRSAKGLYVTLREMAVGQADADGWASTGAARRWRSKIVFQPARQSDVELLAPQIVFLPTGQTTAFEITFGATDQRARRCRSNGWNGLTCDAP